MLFLVIQYHTEKSLIKSGLHFPHDNADRESGSVNPATVSQGYGFTKNGANSYGTARAVTER